jgi:hypothetical protein
VKDDSGEHLVPIRVLARLHRGADRLLANLVGVNERVAMIEADDLAAGDVVTLRFFVPGGGDPISLTGKVTGALDENATLHNVILDDELPESVKEMMMKRGGTAQ